MTVVNANRSGQPPSACSRRRAITVRRPNAHDRRPCSGRRSSYSSDRAPRPVRPVACRGGRAPVHNRSSSPARSTRRMVPAIRACPRSRDSDSCSRNGPPLAVLGRPAAGWRREDRGRAPVEGAHGLGRETTRRRPVPRSVARLRAAPRCRGSGRSSDAPDAAIAPRQEVVVHGFPLRPMTVEQMVDHFSPPSLASGARAATSSQAGSCVCSSSTKLPQNGQDGRPLYIG